MAEIDNVYTCLSVDVDITCDCGENINFTGTSDDKSCECGMNYCLRIGHSGSNHTVVLKQNGEEIYEEEIDF